MTNRIIVSLVASFLLTGAIEAQGNFTKNNHGKSVFSFSWLSESDNAIVFVARYPENEVNGVLYFCTWEESERTLVDRLQNANDWLVKMADAGGYVLVTWPTSKTIFSGESEHDRFTRIDNWAKHWYSAITERESGLNYANVPNFGYGFSRGASYMYSISSKFPTFFSAIHLHCLNFEKPLDRGFADALHLVTFGNSGVDVERGTRFCENLFSSEYFPIVRQFNGLGHEMRSDVSALSRDFFDYCNEQWTKSQLERRSIVSIHSNEISSRGLYVFPSSPSDSEFSRDRLFSGKGALLPAGRMVHSWRGWNSNEILKRISGDAFVAPP